MGTREVLVRTSNKQRNCTAPRGSQGMSNHEADSILGFSRESQYSNAYRMKNLEIDLDVERWRLGMTMNERCAHCQ
jgi:hypothetical protein